MKLFAPISATRTVVARRLGTRRELPQPGLRLVWSAPEPTMRALPAPTRQIHRPIGRHCPY